MGLLRLPTLCSTSRQVTSVPAQSRTPATQIESRRSSPTSSAPWLRKRESDVGGRAGACEGYKKGGLILNLMRELFLNVKYVIVV